MTLGLDGKDFSSLGIQARNLQRIGDLKTRYFGFCASRTTSKNFSLEHERGC